MESHLGGSTILLTYSHSLILDRMKLSEVNSINNSQTPKINFV